MVSAIAGEEKASVAVADGSSISVGSGVAVGTDAMVGEGVEVGDTCVVGVSATGVGVGVGWDVCAKEQAANKLRSRQQRITEKYRCL